MCAVRSLRSFCYYAQLSVIDIVIFIYVTIHAVHACIYLRARRVYVGKKKKISSACAVQRDPPYGGTLGTGSLHFVRLLESSSSSKYRRFPRARRASFVLEVAKAFCGSNNEIGHTHGRRGGIFAAIKRIFKIEHGPQTFGTTSVRFSFDRFTGVRKGRARHA